MGKVIDIDLFDLDNGFIKSHFTCKDIRDVHEKGKKSKLIAKWIIDK